MSKKKPGHSEDAKGKAYYPYIFLSLITIAVYINTLGSEFVFDDESVILSDPSITSISNIPKFFTGELGYHKVIGAYFRPVVSASFTIDHALYGFNPIGFHFTNILIHLLNVLLFFRLLSLIFENYISSYKNYAILFAATIFAIHPVHTEVVSWVSGRTDGLAALFYFMTFIYYIRYFKSGSPTNLIILICSFILALFSKEMSITLPVVIVLYDIMINKTTTLAAIRKKLPVYIMLIFISIAYFLYRQWILNQEVPRESYLYFFGKDGITTFFTMLQVIPEYIRLCFAPYGLVYHYSSYFPYVSGLNGIQVWVGVLSVVVICYAIIYYYRRLPYVSFALLFFIVTLLPVMNIIPTTNLMAERFLYIPSAFLSILIVAVFLKYYSPKFKKAVIAVSVLLVLGLSAMTLSRNNDWKTNEALFLSAEGKPGVVLYLNLGNLYAKQGRFDIAGEYFRKAVELNEMSLMANNNLGKIFTEKGIYDSAFIYIDKARMLDTLSPEPLIALAEMYERSGDLSKSVYWYEKLVSIAPQFLNSTQKLQNVRNKLKETEEKSTPLNDTSISNLQEVNKSGKITALEESSGRKYGEKNYNGAIEELKELIKINPKRAAVYYSNIGMCYMEEKKYNEAIASFDLSLKEDPRFSTAYNNLGKANESLGNKQKALEYYRKALEIEPSNLNAKKNLEELINGK